MEGMDSLDTELLHSLSLPCGTQRRELRGVLEWAK